MSNMFCPFNKDGRCVPSCGVNTGNGCGFFGIYMALERFADILDDMKHHNTGGGGGSHEQQAQRQRRGT